MEIIAILTVLFLVGFTVVISPTRILRSLFCIATFYIGLITITEGITFQGAAIIATNTQIGFVLFVFMTLGSLVSMYGAIISPTGSKEG